MYSKKKNEIKKTKKQKKKQKKGGKFQLQF